LALRLAPSFADVTWVEVDHPATQAAKRRGVERAFGGTASPPQAAAPAPPHFVAADLVHDTTWVDRVPPIDTGATLVILEGVLMYLSPARVESLLRDELMRLRGPRGDALHLVFSYMARDARGRGGFTPSSRLVQWWLRHRQEPFDWMAQPREIEAWLQAGGYAVASHRRPPFGRDDHAMEGVGAGLQGENLVEAVAISN
jgi:O-methyltransferase involved in polyketide biosynthesis